MFSYGSSFYEGHTLKEFAKKYLEKYWNFGRIVPIYVME